MKSETNWRSNEPTLKQVLGIGGYTLVILMLALVVGGWLAGCTTVTPHQVESSGASYDDGVRNSGFIGWVSPTNDAGIFTPHGRDRYNSLIADYGARFHPPLTNDYGVTATTTNTFIFTPEATANFARMLRMLKMEGK